MDTESPFPLPSDHHRDIHSGIFAGAALPAQPGPARPTEPVQPGAQHGTAQPGLGARHGPSASAKRGWERV